MNFIHYQDFIKTDFEIGKVTDIIFQGCKLLRKGIFDFNWVPPTLNRSSFDTKKYGEGIDGLRKACGAQMYIKYYERDIMSITIDTFMIYQFGGLNGNEQFFSVLSATTQDQLDKWKIAYKAAYKLKAFI